MLALNFFRKYYLTLVERGYIFSLRTPIIRAKLKKQTFVFYHIPTFKEWAKTVNDPYTAKYYKGLGTNGDAEIRDIFANPRYQEYLVDGGALEASFPNVARMIANVGWRITPFKRVSTNNRRAVTNLYPSANSLIRK
jgi:hypothetical protein